MMSRVPVSVPDQNPQVAFAATPVPTSSFPFAFPYWQDEDLVVKTRAEGEDWALRLDYDVVPDSGTESTGYPSGAVVFTAPVENVEVLIRREKTFERISQFPNGVPVDVMSLNRDLNRLLGLQQTLRMLMNGFLRLSDEDVLNDPECLTLPAKALRIEKMFAFDEFGCIALLPVPQSITAVFHPSTGNFEVAPDLPVGIAPWLDTEWTQYPDGNSVWISFSIGTDPGVDGWQPPVRFVGQDYAPNIYADPTYSGPHQITLPAGTPPEGEVSTINGFVAPGFIDTVLANTGGATVPLVFTPTEGVPVSWAWDWVLGGAGITITSPAAASTTLSVGAGAATYNGTLRVVVSDGVNSVTRLVQVLIEVQALAADPPAVLSAAAFPADLDQAFDDLAAAYTNYTLVTPVGGRPPFTYLWSKPSGSPNLTLSDLDPANGQQMRFRAVNPDLTNGGVLTATFRCTVRDSAQLDGFEQQVYLVNVPVTVTFNPSVGVDPEPPIIVSVTPNPFSASLSAPSDEPGGLIDTQFLVGNVLNAIGAVSYAWVWDSGGAGVTIVSSGGKDTRLRVGTDSTTFSGVLKLTATDADLRVAEVLVPVSITTAGTAPALTGSVSPVFLSRSVAWGLIEASIGSATAFGGGGTLPYTFSWSDGVLISGSPQVLVYRSSVATAPQANFDAIRLGGVSNNEVSATYQFFCTITDAANKTVTVSVNVACTFLGQSTGDPPLQPF
jgi:hypothetical protein